MEGLIILVVVGVVFAPLAMSIIALVFSSSARRRLRAIEERLAEGTVAAKIQPPVEFPVGEAAPEPPPAAQPGPPPPPAVEPPPLPPLPPTAAMERVGLELTLGGKVSSYAGIAVLLTGIALLVGYAIKNAWLGPGARVVLGLVSGGVLVVLGHLSEVRGKGRLHLLARALTGGGAALFYFCVFAAHGIYHLVGPWMAGVGLLVSAAATLALSLVYRSQGVAVVGVIGAFVTPLLIGGEFEKGAFPLAYIALINLPVIVLGVRRNWQVLYNMAFLFTAAYMFGWMDWMRSAEWTLALGFSTLYFFEFAALGLLKLRGERHIVGRVIDLLRLGLNSLLFMGAVYWVFHKTDHAVWTGVAFLVAAIMHVAIVRVAWRWLPAYREDTLGFLVGGLSFASLALPIQLDGPWVSAGWALEGVILCWFALRSRSRFLLAGAFMMGIVGLMKSLVWDASLYTVPPDLFLNGRFVSGLLASAFLGAQAMLMRKGGRKTDMTGMDWSVALVPLSVLAVALVAVCDSLWTLGPDDPWGWFVGTTMMMVVGCFTLFLADRERGFALPAVLLLCLLPGKIIIDWIVFCSLPYWDVDPFFHGLFWCEIIVAGMTVYVCATLAAREPFTGFKNIGGLSGFVNVFSLIAFIAVVTLEFGRMDSDAGSTGITIWWAVVALGLAVFGLVRNTARHRYLSLALFGMTLLKVFFVDMAELAGLYRVAAFLGLGVLLLVLSYFYQRLAKKFSRES